MMAYGALKGMDTPGEAEPTTTPAEDGGVVVEFPGNVAKSTVQADSAHNYNLVDVLEDRVIASLYQTLTEKIEDDITSRSDWNETAKKSIELLGLKINDGHVSLPFEGASQATDTLLLETVLMWQATALAETMPLLGPAKGVPAVVVPPNAPPDQVQALKQANKRAQEYVNNLLTVELKSYLPRHDRMLFDLGLMGSGFKKIYPDPTTDTGICIEMIPPEDLIVSYHADGVSSGRVNHRLRLTEDQMATRVEAGIYVDRVGEGETTQVASEVEEKRDDVAGQHTSISADKEFLIHEVHCDLVLEGDEHPKGLSRPYIVTLDTATSGVRAVYRNWAEGDEKEKRRCYFARYALLPAKSMVYGYGLGHLLGNTANASQEALRQAMNAALLANLPAGFKHANLSIRDEQRPLRPGEFRDVDAPTGNVSDAFSALPFKGPDQSLILLRESLLDAGRRVAGQAQLNIAESLTNNTPVGTAIAALDEAARIPGSIQRRIFASLTDELAIIREVLLDVLPADGSPREYGEGRLVTRMDIEITRFEPAMRPGSPTRVHRIAEAQAVMQLGAQLPQLHDMRACVVRFYEAIGVENPETLLTPLPAEAQPQDAVSELASALAGKPLVAGFAQDHNSHIQAHAAQMQMLAINPALASTAATAGGALQAHIADHFSKLIAVQTAVQLHIPMEAFAQGQMPPELEMHIAPAVAQAMQAILAQMPKPPDPANTALQVEQMKVEGAMAREELKTQTQKEIATQNAANNEKALQTQLASAAIKSQHDAEKQQADHNLKMHQQQAAFAAKTQQTQSDHATTLQQIRSDHAASLDKIQSDLQAKLHAQANQHDLKMTELEMEVKLEMAKMASQDAAGQGDISTKGKPTLKTGAKEQNPGALHAMLSTIGDTLKTIQDHHKATSAPKKRSAKLIRDKEGNLVGADITDA